MTKAKRKRKSSEEIKEETAFRKAEELSTLCGIEVCMISYGVNGEIKTFPEDRERVAAMASRFTQLTEASRSKKSTSLDDVLKDIQLQKTKTKTKTKRKTEKIVDGDPNLGSQFDRYSIDELNLKLESIRSKFRSIQEYRENMNKIDHGNLDPVVQLVGGIPKAPPTQVRVPQREKIITFGPIARNNWLVPTEKTSVCQKVGNSSSYDYQNYQIKKQKIDHGNITSSSPFPADLGFESSNSNNIFDDFAEEDEFLLDPDFEFDLKEVDDMLGIYYVEEETWNQGPFHQHNNNNNDIQIQHHH